MKALRSTLFLLAIICQVLTFNKLFASPQPSDPILRVVAEEGQPPVIDSITDLTYHMDGYYFTAEFNVFFSGTDNILIKLEEEYDYNMVLLRFYGEKMVHVKTSKLSGLYYSWITIEASNDYGKTKYKIEIPPFFGDAVEEVTDQNPSVDIDGSTLLIRCSYETSVSVTSIDGKTVFFDKINKDTEIPLYPGLFIINYGNSKATHSKKLLIR